MKAPAPTELELDPTERTTTPVVGLAMLALGAFGLSIAGWGLNRDIGWIAQPFYAYAWWSYILLLDGFSAFKCGSSLLTTHRRNLLPICVWSVTFWYFFELLNLRYQNWYYVGVFEVNSLSQLLGRGVYSVACFATVFMGLFETYDALTAAGLFRRWKARVKRYPRWGSYAVQGVGVLMITLSLVTSEYLAPLVWGSVTLIVDPWNYRRGARSLLRDLELGEVGRVVRMLVAGLVCGLVWESLNFFAPQKWVYTVRGLEEFKLFEMPLLGFLGFPALALDAFAAYALVSYLFHGNTTWENPADLRHRPAARHAISLTRFAGMVPLHILFWALVSTFMQYVNVGSVELRLENLEGLRAESIAVLREQGILRPRQLLRAAADAARRDDLGEALGLSKQEMDGLLTEARLYTFKGIGHHHGAALRRAGIVDVEDLGNADPAQLYEQVAGQRATARFPALRREMVRVWVLSARDEGGAGGRL